MKNNTTLSSFQWKIIAFLAIITVINIIDRSAISFAIKPIQGEFGLNNGDFGLISSAFFIGYLFTTFFGGILVDRYGTVGTWAISAILWSIATMLLGASVGFWSFFMVRLALGLTEGLHFPAILRTVSDWLPESWRARASSFGLSGVPVGSVIGAPLTTFLIYAFNWKLMFVILGCLGVIWAIFWLVLFRHHPKALFSSVYSSSLYFTLSKRKQMPWKPLLSNRTFLLSCLGFFSFGYTTFFVLAWLPGYFAQTYGSSTLSLGFLVMPPWICSAVLVIFGGWLSDRLMKKTKSMRISRTYVISLSLLISGLCFIPISFSSNIVLDIFWVSLGLGIVNIVNPPMYAFLADLYGPYAGTAQGIISSFLALGGIVAPTLTGWLTMVSGNFQSAFFFLAALSVITGLIVLIFQNPDKEKPLF